MAMRMLNDTSIITQPPQRSDALRYDQEAQNAQATRLENEGTVQKRNENNLLSKLASASVDQETGQMDWNRFVGAVASSPVSGETKISTIQKAEPEIKQQTIGRALSRYAQSGNIGQLKNDFGAYQNDFMDMMKNHRDIFTGYQTARQGTYSEMASRLDQLIQSGAPASDINQAYLYQRGVSTSLYGTDNVKSDFPPNVLEFIQRNKKPLTPEEQAAVSRETETGRHNIVDEKETNRHNVAMEKKPNAAMISLSGGGAAQLPKSVQDEVTKDAQRVVNGEKSYEMAMSKYTSRSIAGVPIRNALDDKIQELEPTFNPQTNKQQAANAADKTMTRTLVNSASLMDRMKSAEAALDSYMKGDLKAANKAALEIGIQTGDPNSVRAKINQFLVADEAQRIIGSGQGGERALEMSHQLADPTLSPKQTAALMKTVSQYISARRGEIIESMGPFGKMYKKPYDDSADASPSATHGAGEIHLSGDKAARLVELRKKQAEGTLK